MFQRLLLRPAAVKASSERAVLAAGGSICAWLPTLDVTPARAPNDVANRALVLNALVQVAFHAPTSAILAWLDANELTSALSSRERVILDTPNEALSEQQLGDIRWRIEALAALMWAGKRVPQLSFDSPLDSGLASLFPSVQAAQSAAPFQSAFRLRSYRALYHALDLLYRAHWHARDSVINGIDPGRFHEEVIMERRWALEWVLDRNTDWDSVDLST